MKNIFSKLFFKIVIRLYTQLEVLKNKTLRLDNPHISKRRGGRKVAHRRFSLQVRKSQVRSISFCLVLITYNI